MTDTTSINLGGHFTGFATDLTKCGRYKNNSEAVRAGLRLLEEKEKYSIFNSTLAEAKESGESTRNFNDIVNLVIAKRNETADA